MQILSPISANDTQQRDSVHQRWTLDDIPWSEIRTDRVARAEELFYLVATASFMETTTDLYTTNLIELFADDADVTGWLEHHWLPEEKQHGRALEHYVRHAWPGFDWDRGFAGFADEFATMCRIEELEPFRGMEMASRCAVEMGTAAYYTTVSRLSPDPVLARLAQCIFEDEVRHYKYFYRFFLKYRAREGTSRARVVQALWHRLRLINGEDSYAALKHVYCTNHPGRSFDATIYRTVRQRCRDEFAPYFPHEMSVKMLLKPLELGPWTQQVALPIMEALARRLVA
jgi:hypothetical protein